VFGGPIAEILRHVAIETGDRFGGGAMITRDGLPPFLGIELSSTRLAGRAARESVNGAESEAAAPLGRPLLRGGHDESVRFGRLCTTGTIRTQR